MRHPQYLTLSHQRERLAQGVGEGKEYDMQLQEEVDSVSVLKQNTITDTTASNYGARAGLVDAEVDRN